MKTITLHKIFLIIFWIIFAIIFFFILSESGYEEQEERSNCFIQRFWESDEDFQKRCAEE